MENKDITVDELVQLIKELKSGTKTQERPVVVWFDKVGGDLLKYTKWCNVEDFGMELAKQDPEICYNWETGSPFTDHIQCLDPENGVRNITEEERYSFIIPSAIKFDKNGRMIPKIYIHASLSPYMGKNGLTSIQFAKMVYDNLGLPVFLFFPKELKNKIEDDFSGYDECICIKSCSN